MAASERRQPGNLPDPHDSIIWEINFDNTARMYNQWTLSRRFKLRKLFLISIREAFEKFGTKFTDFDKP